MAPSDETRRASIGSPSDKIPHVKLGDLLVEGGVVSRERLDEALAIQQQEGGERRLGRILVDRGFVDEAQLTQFLGRQLSIPWVSLYRVEFARHLLNLVPRRVAEHFCLIPIYVRKLRGQGDTLYVAMDDPSNSEALEHVAAHAKLPVRPMIASTSDICAAIRVYYGAASPSTRAASLARNASKQSVAPVDKSGSDHPAKGISPGGSRRTSTVRVGSERPAKAKLRPAIPPLGPPPLLLPLPPPPPAKKDKNEGTKPRVVSVTLLDGTKLSLPAPTMKRNSRAPARSESLEQELTARDLILALRAAHEGKDVRKVLGENPRWEALFAALLSLLLRKNVIADWEFVEEFRKM